MRRVVRLIGTHLQDSLQNIFDIFIDIIVLKLQDAQAIFFKKTVARFIVFFLSPVNRSVDFHHQPRSVAVKVYDSPMDYLLPSEVETREAVSLQASPQSRFLGRHPAAKLLRPLEQLLPYILTGDYGNFFHA
jgi:hypothetical protein